MKFQGSWTSLQERPVGTRVDLIVCNSEKCSVVFSMPEVATCSGRAWNGFADKQMNRAPFVKPSGNDMHVFHAAPKSSSVNKILRELGIHCCFYFPVTAVETVPVPSTWNYNTNCPAPDLTKMVCDLKKQPKLKNLTQEQNCQSIHTEQGNMERDIGKVTTLYFY